MLGGKPAHPSAGNVCRPCVLEEVLPFTAVTVAARYFKKEFLYEFFREEMAMPHEASIVQDWINQGIEKGRRIGELRARRVGILDILVERFGATKRVTEIGKTLDAIDDPTILRSLHRESIKAASLDDFEKLVEKAAKETGD